MSGPSPAAEPGLNLVPHSGIRVMMEAVRRHPGPVLGLHVGEPNWATPSRVQQAMSRAVQETQSYSPSAGQPALREAIAARATDRGRPTRVEEVVVTAGGTQAISLALSVLLLPGDEVLVPDPGWPNYAMTVQLLGGRPVRYPLRPGSDFQPDIEELVGLVSERTRVLVVNSPSNPLGMIWPPEVMAALLEFTTAQDLWLISDECYEDLVLAGTHVSPAALDPSRVVSCHSFSKSYAMTGHRVGYLLAPPPVAAACVPAQEALLACVNGPAQIGARAALAGSTSELADALRQLRDRSETAGRLLAEHSVEYVRPSGAFFLWLRVPTEQPDSDWALRLLRERSVALVPGTSFGPHGAGWARVSLAVEDPLLMAGLARIIDFGLAA